MADRERYGWKTTGSALKYRNAWISVREDAVVYPDGKTGVYGVLEKPPGVCIVPRAEDGGIHLLRQYRYTVDAEVWELPAGGIQPAETEAAAARRELGEEVGLSARDLERLGNFYTALGHETAEIIVFLATGLEPAPAARERPGDESILEVRKVPLREVRRMIRENHIQCGITLAALNHYLQRL